MHKKKNKIKENDLKKANGGLYYINEDGEYEVLDVQGNTHTRVDSAEKAKTLDWFFNSPKDRGKVTQRNAHISSPRDEFSDWVIR